MLCSMQASNRITIVKTSFSKWQFHVSTYSKRWRQKREALPFFHEINVYNHQLKPPVKKNTLKPGQLFNKPLTFVTFSRLSRFLVPNEWPAVGDFRLDCRSPPPGRWTAGIWKWCFDSDDVPDSTGPYVFSASMLIFLPGCILLGFGSTDLFLLLKLVNSEEMMIFGSRHRW